MDALVADARRYAGLCAERAGDVLEHVSTTDVARDVDLLRAALGEDRLTFLGFSYGTFVGATYASLFPDRQGRLVLDGALDAQWLRREPAGRPARAGRRLRAGPQPLPGRLRGRPGGMRRLRRRGPVDRLRRAGRGGRRGADPRAGGRPGERAGHRGGHLAGALRARDLADARRRARRGHGGRRDDLPRGARAGRERPDRERLDRQLHRHHRPRRRVAARGAAVPGLRPAGLAPVRAHVAERGLRERGVRAVAGGRAGPVPRALPLVGLGAGGAGGRDHLRPGDPLPLVGRARPSSSATPAC